MRILGAELREIRLPLREPFTSASGSRFERRILLLRISGDEGVDGWGECVAGEDPSYSYETTETAWEILTRWLLPALPGRELLGPELDDVGAPPVRGHPMAKAAIETAIWDLEARGFGVPLWELLGGSGDPIAVGVTLGLQADTAALVERVERCLERGYARVKIKIRPGDDVAPLRAVRDRFPDLALWADANGAYDSSDLAPLRALDDLGLGLIEQPFSEDLRAHAALQAVMTTPICLDESIRTPADAALALELGACRIVNVKPGRVGGHAAARRIHDLCREAGVPVWCGGMLESGVGRAHNLALATLPGFSLPGDLSESRRYWERDVVRPEFTLEGGRMPIPSGPGIGVEPDRARISDLTVREARIGAPL